MKAKETEKHETEEIQDEPVSRRLCWSILNVLRFPDPR
jgi:hypothetical protein